MKFLFLIALLGISMLGMAQPVQKPAAIEARLFQPLSLPGQQRPVVEPEAPLLSRQGVYYVVLTVLLLAILAAAVWICWKLSSIILRILTVMGALGISAFVSFVLLTMIGLTGTPDNSRAGLARRALFEMGKHLGMSIETIAAIVEDDEYRIGFLIGDRAMAVADYGENRGLLAPYTHVDSVISHEGTGRELPALPTPNSDHWVIETEAARHSSDTVRLQQIEWRFRGIKPGIITVRYAHPDYFFPEVTSIAVFCRQRMEEMR